MTNMEVVHSGKCSPSLKGRWISMAPRISFKMNSPNLKCANPAPKNKQNIRLWFGQLASLPLLRKSTRFFVYQSTCLDTFIIPMCNYQLTTRFCWATVDFLFFCFFRRHLRSLRIIRVSAYIPKTFHIWAWHCNHVAAMQIRLKQKSPIDIYGYSWWFFTNPSEELCASQNGWTSSPIISGWKFWNKYLSYHHL